MTDGIISDTPLAVSQPKLVRRAVHEVRLLNSTCDAETTSHLPFQSRRLLVRKGPHCDHRPTSAGRKERLAIKGAPTVKSCQSLYKEKALVRRIQRQRSAGGEPWLHLRWASAAVRRCRNPDAMVSAAA